MMEDTLPLGRQFESPHPYPLGTWVQFRHPLERRERRVLRGTTRDLLKVWEPTKASEWREGVVMGYRNLADGNLLWDEWGNHFTPTRHFRAYLIAFDIYRTPVHVRTEDVLPLEGAHG